MLSATECGARSATWREQAKRCCGTRSQPDHNPFRLWTASAGGLSSLYYVCYHFLSYPLRPDPFALATLARSVSPALSHYPLLLTGFLCVLMPAEVLLSPPSSGPARPDVDTQRARRVRSPRACRAWMVCVVYSATAKANGERGGEEKEEVNEGIQV
ncbi:unnamed protein product [Heligmosomoides polygyrus]|uniref:DUF1736 domain-containing protein n=1 Tax=Heligmosomoides polygyrus TaxID=6339 RepID=A0A183FR57_HELPZ|nr:unnamed protein product [Heligmosomoides polygyrus]